VRNQDARWRLPFGLAIHPYFRIIGPRESIRLQVPAKKWMESIEQMPTGRLIDLAGGPVDLCKPRSLSGLDLDDVYWGADPDRQQIIYYDQIGKKVTLTASDFFTHCVVYTPAGKPFFCIENQSCSTDAHNLYARGLEEAAHLTILDPGESLTASVVIAVGEQ
jgi:aldose 1-epimerase